MRTGFPLPGTTSHKEFALAALQLSGETSARRSAMGTIWVFKTNYADPVYQVEFSSGPGMRDAAIPHEDLLQDLTC